MCTVLYFSVFTLYCWTRARTFGAVNFQVFMQNNSLSIFSTISVSIASIMIVFTIAAISILFAWKRIITRGFFRSGNLSFKVAHCSPPLTVELYRQVTLPEDIHGQPILLLYAVKDILSCLSPNWLSAEGEDWQRHSHVTSVFSQASCHLLIWLCAIFMASLLKKMAFMVSVSHTRRHIYIYVPLSFQRLS